MWTKNTYSRSTCSRLCSMPQNFDGLRRKEMDKMHFTTLSWFIVLGTVLLSLAPSALWAQAQNASIIGVVTDDSGSVIPKAQITVTSPSLQVPQLTTTA